MVNDPFENFARIIIVFGLSPVPLSFAGFISPLSLFPIQIYLDRFQAFALVWMMEK